MYRVNCANCAVVRSNRSLLRLFYIYIYICLVSYNFLGWMVLNVVFKCVCWRIEIERKRCFIDSSLSVNDLENDSSQLRIIKDTKRWRLFRVLDKLLLDVGQGSFINHYLLMT